MASNDTHLAVVGLCAYKHTKPSDLLIPASISYAASEITEATIDRAAAPFIPLSEQFS